MAVLDAMEAFISGGPEAGATVSPGAILVGRHRVALAAVGVTRLRLSGARGDVASGPLLDQAQIGRAAALGLGAASPEAIDLVMDDQAGRQLVRQLRAVLTEGRGAR